MNGHNHRGYRSNCRNCRLIMGLRSRYMERGPGRRVIEVRRRNGRGHTYRYRGGVPSLAYLAARNL